MDLVVCNKRVSFIHKAHNPLSVSNSYRKADILIVTPHVYSETEVLCSPQTGRPEYSRASTERCRKLKWTSCTDVGECATSDRKSLLLEGRSENLIR